MDLSSPNGESVNDGISKEISSCQYTSVMVAAQRVLKVGKGALLAKMDIKQAYCNISVAPEDRHLLGFQWDDHIYVDLRLPFGLRSAPFIFSSVADALLGLCRKMVSHGKSITWTTFLPSAHRSHRNAIAMFKLCNLSARMQVSQLNHLSPKALPPL